MATSKKTAATQSAAPQVEPDLPDEVPNAAEAVEAIVEPAMEMQETVRHELEKAVVDTRAAFVRVKASAEDAANAFELSLNAAKDGVLTFSAKAFAAARANAEANLEFVKASLVAKSPGDFAALQSEFAKKQADAVAAQLKELAEIAQKTVVETFEPFK